MALNLGKTFLAGLVVLLFIADGGEAADAAQDPDTFIYERNGVRLVGGDATYGRLELLSRRHGEWVTVCGKYFRDTEAQMMCVLLGYKYGRTYYDPKLVHLVNNPSSQTQVDIYSCGNLPTTGLYDDRHHRRLRGILPAESLDSQGGEHNKDEHSLTKMQSRRRSMFSPAISYINTSDSAPYTCRLSSSPCNRMDGIATVGAIQCSNTSFPPAPPPPPTPPPPLPSPPSLSTYIRFIGSVPNHFQSDGLLHPNLCATDSAAGVCGSFARLEILVDSPNKRAPGKIWAPVCNIAYGNLAKFVGLLACEQRYQALSAVWRMPIFWIDEKVSKTPFYMPNATSYAQLGEGDFNPKNVGGFVTITGYGNATEKMQLQDLAYKVSLNPCSRGAMLAVACKLSPFAVD